MSEVDAVREQALPTNGHAKVKGPRAHQVQAWYALLCDLGLDRYVQATLDAASKRKLRPITAAEQTGDVPVSEAEEAAFEVHIDVGRIFQAIAQEGALQRMIAIVMDVSEAEADDIAMDDFQERVVPFVRASLTPFTALFGSAGAITLS